MTTNKQFLAVISIIIPTYGPPIYLEKAINSVLNQTYDKFELIVVDDNDKDTESRVLTEKIIDNIKNRGHDINYIKHDSNKNGAVARNTGVKASRGKYISFLDSDDEYMPNRLANFFIAIENSSLEIAGIYSGCEFRRNNKRYLSFKDVKSGNFLIETLSCSFMFCTGSNLFIRKSVYNELGGFDEKFVRHQDYEFLVRLFQKYNLIAIPEILVIKNNENFNLPNVDKMIAVKSLYLEKYKDLIAEQSIENQNLIFQTNHIQIAEQALKSKQNKCSVKYYNLAKKHGDLSAITKRRRIILYLYNFFNKWK